MVTSCIWCSQVLFAKGRKNMQGQGGEFIHNFVVFCFHLGHGPFKTCRYPITIKVAEAVSRFLYKRKSSFLPLFFYSLSRKTPLPKAVGFFLGEHSALRRIEYKEAMLWQ